MAVFATGDTHVNYKAQTYYDGSTQTVPQLFNLYYQLYSLENYSDIDLAGRPYDSTLLMI